MSKTYSAGIVTAYGAAKRAGYTGTYEDFCRQQAGYAESAATVEQAKNTAVSAANTATAKASEATTAATAAQTAKTQTEQAASQALTDISTARSGAISAVQTEGQTQTANARAQAQAAATSATTASTKASEASASATSAGQSATNAAASATSAANAASAAQGVLESIPEDYSDLSEDVDKLKADLGDLEDATTTTETSTQQVTESITPTWTSGYMTQNGSTYSNDSYVYSSPISVSAGDVIQPLRSDNRNINTMRYVTCFNGNNAVTDIGGTNVSTPYTVPNGCDSIVITISSAYVNPYVNRTYTTQAHTYIPILKPNVDALLAISASAEPNRLKYNFSLSGSNAFESTEAFEDLCGYRICFIGKITSITDVVKIGKGIGQTTYGGGIGFDGTNLYQYLGTSSDPVRTQAHGLTLKDYVSIVLDANYTVGAKCTISTNGGTFTWEIPYWRSRCGTLTVTSSDAIANCELTYTCEGITKEAWIYGDSYLSNHGTDRWSAYLVLAGYRNYLLNGYPGRNSIQALASLKVDLSMKRKPRRLLWLLGMNDKDGADAVNANWLACVQEVMQICEDGHIELILATIPNVPSTNTKNTLKNAYVVESGYRYIDFANAVSANGDSTWYDNMLSADNVHPDTQGALALYGCAVSEVPELLL